MQPVQSQLPLPKKRLIGWTYRGNWFLFTSRVAYEYWMDLVYEVATAHWKKCYDSDEMSPIPPVAMPVYSEVLESLK
jgi:hypothetical protein